MLNSLFTLQCPQNDTWNNEKRISNNSKQQTAKVTTIAPANLSKVQIRFCFTYFPHTTTWFSNFVLWCLPIENLGNTIEKGVRVYFIEFQFHLLKSVTVNILMPNSSSHQKKKKKNIYRYKERMKLNYRQHEP